MGWRSGLSLKRARCNIFYWPQMPFHGHLRGLDFSRIARVTNERQRLGLALFREARSSNNVLLSILLYWQVLEIRNEPIGWVNKSIRRHPRHLFRVREYLPRLPLGTRNLGEYLNDDCRHAIAHIKRKPGKAALKFDNLEEDGRLRLSEAVLEELAKFYISSELGVSEQLWLVRRGGTGFPTYLDQATIKTGYYRAVR